MGKGNLMLATALAMMVAIPASIGSAAAAETTLSQHCEDLARAFNELKVTHVAPGKMKMAKEQAEHGQKMCKTDPNAGIAALDLAFRDVGRPAPHAEMSLED